MAALCVVLGVGVVRLGDDAGPDSAERVVALYVDALRRGDAAAVARLAEDERATAAAAVERVTRLGGRPVSSLVATYHADLGPDQRDVDLRGAFADGSAFADRIVVERRRPGVLRRLAGADERWELRLVGTASDVRAGAMR